MAEASPRGEALPTPGQSFTLFYYNTNGLVSQRDRRYDSGLRQVYDFLWDADDRSRTVQEAGTTRFSALYDGGGTRVHKEDTRSGVLTANDYSYGPGGLLWSSNPNTVYTPGFGHRSNGVSTFYHTDWLGSTRYTSDSTGNAFPRRCDMMRLGAGRRRWMWPTGSRPTCSMREGRGIRPSGRARRSRGWGCSISSNSIMVRQKGAGR